MNLLRGHFARCGGVCFPLRRWLRCPLLVCRGYTLKAFQVVPKPTDPSSDLVAKIYTWWVSSSRASLCAFFLQYTLSLLFFASWLSCLVNPLFTNVTRLRACRFLDICSIFAICCPLRGERASFLFARLLSPRWRTRIFGLVV